MFKTSFIYERNKFCQLYFYDTVSITVPFSVFPPSPNSTMDFDPAFYVADFPAQDSGISVFQEPGFWKFRTHRQCSCLHFCNFILTGWNWIQLCSSQVEIQYFANEWNLVFRIALLLSFYVETVFSLPTWQSTTFVVITAGSRMHKCIGHCGLFSGKEKSAFANFCMSNAKRHRSF